MEIKQILDLNANIRFKLFQQPFPILLHIDLLCETLIENPTKINSLNSHSPHNKAYLL